MKTTTIAFWLTEAQDEGWQCLAFMHALQSNLWDGKQINYTPILQTAWQRLARIAPTHGQKSGRKKKKGMAVHSSGKETCSFLPMFSGIACIYRQNISSSSLYSSPPGPAINGLRNWVPSFQVCQDAASWRTLEKISRAPCTAGAWVHEAVEIRMDLQDLVLWPSRKKIKKTRRRVVSVKHERFQAHKSVKWPKISKCLSDMIWHIFKTHCLTIHRLFQTSDLASWSSKIALGMLPGIFTFTHFLPGRRSSASQSRRKKPGRFHHPDPHRASYLQRWPWGHVSAERKSLGLVIWLVQFQDIWSKTYG